MMMTLNLMILMMMVMTMVGVNFGELFVNEDDGWDGDYDEDVEDYDDDIPDRYDNVEKFTDEEDVCVGVELVVDKLKEVCEKLFLFLR